MWKGDCGEVKKQWERWEIKVNGEGWNGKGAEQSCVGGKMGTLLISMRSTNGSLFSLMFPPVPRCIGWKGMWRLQKGERGVRRVEERGEGKRKEESDWRKVGELSTASSSNYMSLQDKNTSNRFPVVIALCCHFPISMQTLCEYDSIAPPGEQRFPMSFEINYFAGGHWLRPFACALAVAISLI